ncbi:glycine-rich domain-containing protein [Paraflavitalea soli]|uniref:glycine-rich domain-containing protein n=1 Tax=Paraflavitalea soli TaxID=2315862 RepID=UPI0013C50128|nr:hypothetical protein [Paraflavitalea soli]
MIIDESLLWSKLESFSPDNPNDVLSFSQRLARENGWPPLFTERVIAEYKRFIFLCMISPQPVTPSDEVDQAWHLHLVYTKSYWNDLCRNILGKDIHHTPTEGGPAERDKFISYYESTLQLYRHKFGNEPPDDIWPTSDKRFGAVEFVRANTSTHWILRKRRWHPKLTGILFILLGFVGGAITSHFGVLFMFLFLGLSMIAQPNRSRSNRESGGCGGGCSGCGGDSGDSGCGGDGGCSGGCGGGCGGGD